MSYLKYYFGREGGKLFFDSVTCIEGKTPVKPVNFLKWYEDGDFAPLHFNEEATKSESPMFAAAFASREVTFPID